MDPARIRHRYLAAAAFVVLAVQSPARVITRQSRRPAESVQSQRSRANVSSGYGKLPLAFEPNVGQTDARVRFLARGGGMVAFFTDTETAMVLSRAERRDLKTLPLDRREPAKVEQTVVRMKLTGASQPRQAIGLEKLAGISNYFIGNNPAKWHTDVPHYGRIQYEGVYPGIDLVWYGNQRRLEYDFVVAAGADPKQIQVAYEGVRSLGVEAGGDLLGEVRQQQPKVYQEIAGKRVEVGAKYLVAHNRVGFELATYDRQRELRIDPVVLVYSTLLGGTYGNSGSAITVDAAGSAYVTGCTVSADFPVQSPYQSSANLERGYPHVIVTKLTPAGSALVYSTYLGGNSYDYGNAIAVDAAGSAYVTGTTTSTDFPTQSAYQATLLGGPNPFVTKLAPEGNALVYSTYLGGSSYEECYGIAVDGAGSAYVTGYSSSSNFPVQAAYQATLKGLFNAFVTKLTPAGTALVYSTYLGGSAWDGGTGIAVDATGSAYIVGQTASPDFPTESPYQATNQGGQGDGFVTKLTPDGSALVYSTYLGGSADDYGSGIAVDGAGSAYVVGATKSADFPTQAPFQAAYQGTPWDGFVTKLTPAGDALVYSTYLGGSAGASSTGIAVDGAGSAYVTGSTGSSDFPIQFAYQATLSGGGAFVAKLTPAGTALAYSTYLGGSAGASGAGVAVDGAGSAYVTGSTGSSDFPTEAPYQAVAGLYGDAFVAKLSLQSLGLKHTGNFILGQNGVTYTVTVSNLASAGSTSGTVTVTETVPPGLTLVSMAGTGWTCPAGGVTCQRSDPLPGGSSYPDIMATVNVASDATSPLVNAVSMGGALTGYATNSTTILPLTSVTVTTSPGGLSIIVDGASYTAPQSFNWVPLSNHTLNVSSPQGAGTGYIFTNWIDDGQQSRTITTPYSAITYTAEFATQYLLTTSIVPSGAGSTVANPSSGDGYYDPGTSVQLTAMPASGYAFSNFSGDLTGGNNPQSVVMSAPRTVTAMFLSTANGSQTITFAALANRPLGTAPFTVSATASSGLAVSFNSQTTSVCTVSGAAVTLVAVGTCTIQAAQFGDIDYAGTQVSQSFQVTPGTLSLDQQNVYFGATNNGAIVTAPQTVSVIVPAGASWSVSSSLSYVVVSPASGVGSGTFTIGVQNTALPSPASINATVTVTATEVSNSPQYVYVSLNVMNAGATAPPFGIFDTPANGATGLAASVAVTGWALDAIGVQKVQIWRDPVSGETPTSNGLIYIGDATFVPGARPDVQALYPNYPLNNRAGWGYLMLTNGLPNNGGSAGTGNGIYTLHAIATSIDGNTTDLGSKTITCDNADATTPFGAIDTPGQGATVSGTIINFGWALTPQPYSIPIDGSTIWVTVDGQYLGHPVYNQYRSDIATGFPGYANANGAVGYYYLDTTTLTNGIHTMGWLVTDNDGRAAGIGSRFIWVLN